MGSRLSRRPVGSVDGIDRDADPLEPGLLCEIEDPDDRPVTRRRGEEGLVRIRLTIGPEGRLESIDLDGRASSLLRRATQKAVEAAAPFPAPPRGEVVIEIPVSWRVRP